MTRLVLALLFSCAAPTLSLTRSQRARALLNEGHYTEALELFTAAQFGEWVRPERMIAPEP